MSLPFRLNVVGKEKFLFHHNAATKLFNLNRNIVNEASFLLIIEKKSM